LGEKVTAGVGGRMWVRVVWAGGWESARAEMTDQ
jgi:hypothetical protein